MELWNDFTALADKYGGRLQLMFIYSSGDSKDIKELYQQMRLSTFGYPMILDPNESFISMNPWFPSEPLLQTMLLDKDNRIIAVGDPLFSDKLNEHYLRLIERRLHTYNPLRPKIPYLQNTR